MGSRVGASNWLWGGRRAQEGVEGTALIGRSPSGTGRIHGGLIRRYHAVSGIYRQPGWSWSWRCSGQSGFSYCSFIVVVHTPYPDGVLSFKYGSTVLPLDTNLGEQFHGSSMLAVKLHFGLQLTSTSPPICRAAILRRGTVPLQPGYRGLSWAVSGTVSDKGTDQEYWPGRSGCFRPRGSRGWRPARVGGDWLVVTLSTEYWFQLSSPGLK